MVLLAMALACKPKIFITHDMGLVAEAAARPDIESLRITDRNLGSINSDASTRL